MPTLLSNAPARLLFLWLMRRLRWPKTPDPRVTPGALPHLSDRMARDIGLTATETEQARLRLPSLHGPRHPML